MKKMSVDEFAKRYHAKNPDIDVVSRDNDYNVEFFCHKCNQKFIKNWHSSKQYKGCPICHMRKVIPGVNDVATSHPWVVKYLKDKSLGNKLSHGSTKSVEVICPKCGSLSRMQMLNLSYQGYTCHVCNDGISFPNKFSRALLKRLPVENVQYEYSPKWISPKRFDNYFEYKGYGYVLEMDGGFHYIDNTYSGESVKRAKDIDFRKELSATFHGIEVIRIDCRSLDYNSIAVEFRKSKLNELFDLDSIDWKECAIEASKSKLLSACDMYKEHKPINDIVAELGINRHTVRRYLIEGSKLGIIVYNPKTSKDSQKKEYSLYKDGKLLLSEKGFTYFGEKMQLMFPSMDINIKSMRTAYQTNNGIYKGFVIKEKKNELTIC